VLQSNGGSRSCNIYTRGEIGTVIQLKNSRQLQQKNGGEKEKVQGSKDAQMCTRGRRTDSTYPSKRGKKTPNWRGGGEEE